MSKMRILLDIDGVLADFVTPALALINEITRQQWQPSDVTQHDMTRACALTPEQTKRWQVAISAPGFCANIQPYPGVVEALMTLRKDASLIAVTAPLDNGTGRAAPHWKPERWDWLLAHGFGAREIIFTNDKTHIDGDVFVDDNAHHVDTWRARRGLRAHSKGAFLFDRPWNANDTDMDDQRIMSLDALVSFVKFNACNPKR